jgi:enoyl reductase-like protein
MENKIYIKVSIGELLDRLSILHIKRIMISDLEKVNFAKKEASSIKNIAKTYLENSEIEKLYDLLIITNKNLWDVENVLRDMESKKIFDEEFITKARSVYMLNDRRNDLKNQINNILNCETSEVKEYTTY